MGRPTYAEIARAAEVGTATVERVLNGRGGVRPATVARVVAAARRLDWPGRLPDRHAGILRIEVLLVRPETAFFARLARAFRRIAATLDRAVQVQVTFVDEGDTAGFVQRITAPKVPRSALILSSPARPDIRDALGAIAPVHPVIQVVTRTLPGAAYVGIDNPAAGRMAGLLMARLAAPCGTVLGLCHSPVYQVHRDRMSGFSDAFSRHAPEGLGFAHIAFGRDDDTANARCLRAALRAFPDLVGVYNCGGGNAGLFETVRHARRDLTVIGHELDEVSRAALAEGTADVILDQAPEAQARRAIDMALSRMGQLAEPVDSAPIRFTTETAETL